MEVIKEEDRVIEEEDLVEVADMLFSIIAECQGTTCGSVRIKHSCHVNIAVSLKTI